MKRRNFMMAAAAPLAAARARAAKTEAPKKGNVAYHFESEPSMPFAAYGQATRDPKLTYRASGGIYMLAVVGGHAGSSLGLATSGDGGDSFSPPTPVSPKDAKVSSHGENSPSFSFSPGIEAYALWERSTGRGIGTELMLSRSPAFGHVWTGAVKVTDKAEPSTNAFSYMNVSPRGEIFAVWLDGRDPDKHSPGTSSVYLAKSTDGGESFEPNVPVAHGACPCCRPTVAFGADGAVHVSWRHVYPENLRDMAVATSTDGGKTFGEPVRVAEDRWKINGCPHSGASMVVTGARLWVTWYSDGDGSNPGVRLAWSDDRGKSFSDPVMASASVLDANHPDMAIADDGRLLMVFQGREPGREDGWAPAGPWLVEIAPSGKASSPILVPGHKQSISYPRVAGGTLGRVAVAWSEKDEKGQSQIRLSRGRRKSADS